MKLTELDPRWVHGNVFVFRCPHCRAAGITPETWISCKDVALGIGAQFEIFAAAQLQPAGKGADVVPMAEDYPWKIDSRDFATMSVTPSIDASRSGHWHGHITNGEIR